jgi:GR25 family glycosyltransferase involved in LPS biosynthesis
MFINKKKCAPIILFVYRRIHILKKVIESLKRNKLAAFSEIYIFSDGYKNSEDKKNVLKVREFLKKLKGFKKVTIVCRKYNLGLADNIIDGTSAILKIKKKGIILEDDIIVSPNFLDFMNLSLEKFKNKKKVWHINAWNYQIKELAYNDTFYWRGMHCWGWATWYDRWTNFKKNPEQLIKLFDNRAIKKFNYDGHYNFWNQVLRNYKAKINTWAIFWYATIFLNKGLCLSPRNSLTLNIGYDTAATNALKSIFINDKFANNSFQKNFTFQKIIIENSFNYSQIKKYLLIKKIKSLLFGYFDK